MSNPNRSEEEVTTILMALVAWGGNCTKASQYLKSEKGIGIAGTTLQTWKTKYGERYDELREKFRDQLEVNLANEMREVARLAVEVERLALEKAQVALKEGTEKDPARAAANLARVAQSSVDKVMTLTARPTSITETRDASEILRKLVSMGVLQAPDSEQPPELPEVTAA